MGPKEDGTLNELQELSKQLGVNDKINYLGMVTGEGYCDALAGADLFVLNSYSENYANVVIEALSMGTPVLISDQVGVKDIVMEYDAGIVSSLDVEEIAAAMRSLLIKPERLNEMGQNGIKLSRNFSSSIIGEQMRTYFEEIIESSR
jgi:glycosyltransferase involved in cell wall biosynthesis